MKETSEQLLLRISGHFFERLSKPELIKLLPHLMPQRQIKEASALPEHELLELVKHRSVSQYLTGFANFCNRHLGGRLFVEQVGALFPGLPGEKSAGIARQLFINEYKNGCYEILFLALGLEALRPFVKCKNVDILRQLHCEKKPAILAFWHLGPQFVLGPALKNTGIPCLILIKASPAFMPLPELFKFAAPNLEYLVLSNLPGGPAFAFKRCIEHLQKGGFVSIAADGRQGVRQVAVSFLGRPVQIGTGVSALARLTAAPVIPITWNWLPDSWDVEFRFHEPISLLSGGNLQDFDTCYTAGIANWFEKQVLLQPELLRMDRLPMMLGLPKPQATNR